MSGVFSAWLGFFPILFYYLSVVCELHLIHVVYIMISLRSAIFPFVIEQSSFVSIPYSTMYLTLCLFSFLLAFRLLIFMSWSCSTIQNKFHKYSLFLTCFNLFCLLFYFRHNYIILGLSIYFRSLIKDDIFLIFYYLNFHPNLILFPFGLSSSK